MKNWLEKQEYEGHIWSALMEKAEYSNTFSVN
jgi:hypothetical protein